MSRRSRKSAPPPPPAPRTGARRAAGAPKGPSGPWLIWLCALVIAGAVLAAYSNSCRGPLILDDIAALETNPSIVNLSHLSEVLSPPPQGTTGGRPILNLSFALNFAVSGNALASYHAANLTIHVAAALLLFGLVRRALGVRRLAQAPGAPSDGLRTGLALAVALLWGLHPVQTESVSYISQRAESLMGLFYLLVLYGLVRSNASDRPRPWLAVSVAAAALGMGVKEVMVTVPVVALLFDRAFLSDSFRGALRTRPRYYAGLAASWGLLALLMAGSKTGGASVGYSLGVGAWTYALTEARVIVRYIGLCLWPHPLVFDYGTEILSAGPGADWPYAAALLAALGGAAWAWRRSPAAAFAASSFFILLSPTSSFVPVALQPMAESRLYLPLACVLVLVVLGAHRLGGRRCSLLLLLLAPVLAVLTYERNRVYGSNLLLWADTVARQPGNARARSNYAVQLWDEPGQLQAACDQYEAALRIKPDYPEAHLGRANCLARMPGRLEESLAEYAEALRLRPTYAEVPNDRGNTLLKVPGRLDEAIASFELALRLAPGFAEAHNNLGSALAGLPARRDEAIAHFRRALELFPAFPEAHYNLGCSLAERPETLTQAIAEFSRALSLKPDYAAAHANMAAALLKTGHLDEAIAHLQAAVDLNPPFVEEARANLEKCEAYRRSTQLSGAQRPY